MLGEDIPIVVDYFCGAGGFTCGALMAGAVVACGIDSDERVMTTYVENNRNPSGETVPFYLGKIEETEPKEIARYLTIYPKRPVVFVACPPCQPFTNLRTTKKRSPSSRNALLVFLDHVEKLRPDFVLAENVPGIRAKKYGHIWQKAVRRLETAGYAVRSETVNAARYGVPQKRFRTFLVASRHDEPPWPKPTYGPGSYRTVRDAWRTHKLCRLEAGAACRRDRDHVAAGLSDLNLRRIKAIVSPGGSRTSWPSELQLACYGDHTGHTDVYGRMDWDRPAPTLTTRFVSLSNGRFGHPEEHRAITPREGALLQSFPPGYSFLHASRDVNVVHIGNAVPPALAYAFIAVIRESLRTKGAR